jgi:arylsulfatase A-like enzyme
MSDDLGYGELGSYGQKLILTPHLDQMASDGIRFTNFYSGSTVCAPSRATLLTGHHTGHNFIRGNGNPPLPTEPATLSMLIKQAGYKTGIIGKWGMGGVDTPGAPSAQRFDEFIGFLGHKHAHDQFPDHLFRGDERFDLPEGTYANDLFTSEAVEFISRHKSDPFFLFLSYTIPHQKLQVPSQGAYAAKDWPAAERNKAAMISRMDAGIGQVLQELQAQGLDKNTLVLFTSDNGPHTEDGTDPEFFESNGPLRGIKRDLYEGGIRVPMIARYPAVVPSGQTNAQPWAMWDILPTLLDFIGAPAPSDRDGVSMKAAFIDSTVVDHEPLYWEFYERGFTQAVRQDQWKLIKTSSGTLELYNLAEDIGETANLASDHPDKLMELMPLLTSMRTDSERWDLSEVNNREKKKQQKKRQNQSKKNNSNQ